MTITDGDHVGVESDHMPDRPDQMEIPDQEEVVFC